MCFTAAQSYSLYTAQQFKTMATTTLSIRIPAETRRWLEKFSRSRGSLSSAAARLIEEARRRELFRGVEFRDTPHGRLAYVQGTRVAVYFAWMAARDYSGDAEKVASHFTWPLWKAESALAYAAAFPDEIKQQVAEHGEWDDASAMKRLLPGLRISEPPP